MRTSLPLEFSGQLVRDTTREPLNEIPVTDHFMSQGQGGLDLVDCRKSSDGDPYSTSNFRRNHSGSAFFLFGDGYVRYLNENISLFIYRGLSTIRGGEIVLE